MVSRLRGGTVCTGRRRYHGARIAVGARTVAEIFSTRRSMTPPPPKLFKGSDRVLSVGRPEGEGACRWSRARSQTTTGVVWVQFPVISHPFPMDRTITRLQRSNRPVLAPDSFIAHLLRYLRQGNLGGILWGSRNLGYSPTQSLTAPSRAGGLQ